MIISNNDEMMYKRNGAQKFCVPIILKWYVWCECVCRSSFLFGSIFGNRCQYRDKHQAYNRLRMQGYIAFYCKIKCFGVNDCKRRQQRRCDDDDDKIVVFRTIYSIFDGFLLRSVCHTEEHPWHPYLACSFISRCFIHLMITIFSTDFVYNFSLLVFCRLVSPSSAPFSLIKMWCQVKSTTCIAHIKLHHFRRNRHLYCFMYPLCRCIDLHQRKCTLQLRAVKAKNDYSYLAKWLENWFSLHEPIASHFIRSVLLFNRKNSIIK